MGLTFAGYAFEDYGVTVDTVESWPKPERDRTTVHVPGRNGDLILDNGCWNNVAITYHCLIKDGWKDSFREFVRMLYQLHGYHALYDDNHPGVYRMAEFAGPITPELWFTTETGVFDLTFNCKPQMYITGIEPITLDFTAADAETSLDNIYGMEAFPLLRIFATTGAQITLGEWTIVVAANSFYGIVIDCENETCWAIDEFGDWVQNANSYVTITAPNGETAYDFPYIPLEVGVPLEAWHNVYDGEGALVNTYRGTLEFSPRWTEI